MNASDLYLKKKPSPLGRGIRYLLATYCLIWLLKLVQKDCSRETIAAAGDLAEAMRKEP